MMSISYFAPCRTGKEKGKGKGKGGGGGGGGGGRGPPKKSESELEAEAMIKKAQANQGRPVLHDISLSVERGQLCCIVGGVGAIHAYFPPTACYGAFPKYFLSVFAYELT